MLEAYLDVWRIIRTVARSGLVTCIVAHTRRQACIRYSGLLCWCMGCRFCHHPMRVAAEVFLMSLAAEALTDLRFSILFHVPTEAEWLAEGIAGGLPSAFS